MLTCIRYGCAHVRYCAQPARHQIGDSQIGAHPGAEQDDLDLLGDLFLPQRVAAQAHVLARPFDAAQGAVQVLQTALILGQQRTVEQLIQRREQVVIGEFAEQIERLQVQAQGIGEVR